MLRRERERRLEERLENLGQCFGKSDPPPPPDYAAAAKAQGGANVQAAIASNILNNPTQVTPYGTMSRVQTGTYTIPEAEGNAAFDVPLFTQTQEFTPEGQARWDQEQRIVGNLGGVAEAGLSRVGESMATPFSFNSASEAQKAAEEAVLSRMNPQLERNQDATRTRLANQGLVAGGEAWNNEMRVLGQQENDARMQAVMQGFNVRPQVIQEEAYLRSLPLNELNALRTGSQVAPFSFSGSGNQSIAAAPVFGATQEQSGYSTDLFNAKNAQQGQTTAAIGTIGTAAAMVAF